MPIPLALLDVYLVLLSDRPSHLWRDDSWWASCRGPLWGQLPTAVSDVARTGTRARAYSRAIGVGPRTRKC